jgi:hypothetical protein
MRWWYLSSYCGYNALDTDRYPPCTLAEVPDYPATREVAYPKRLSRGLVLKCVISTLATMPHQQRMTHTEIRSAPVIP